jgi:hypothetical protein
MKVLAGTITPVLGVFGGWAWSCRWAWVRVDWGWTMLLSSTVPLGYCRYCSKGGPERVSPGGTGTRLLLRLWPLTMLLVLLLKLLLVLL